MDAFLSWYCVGVFAWFALLIEFKKKYKLQYILEGFLFGLAGLFAIIVFLLMEKEGLFDD